jgi:hypothetical protein
LSAHDWFAVKNQKMEFHPKEKKDRKTKDRETERQKDRKTEKPENGISSQSLEFHLDCFLKVMNFCHF